MDPPRISCSTKPIEPVIVKLWGCDDVDTWLGDLLGDNPIPGRAPYVLIRHHSGRWDVILCDLGRATLTEDGRVHLEPGATEAPSSIDRDRLLLVVRGPAAYHAMGISHVMALREHQTHPMVCVIPEGIPRREERRLVAIHLIELYDRLPDYKKETKQL